MSVDLRNFLRDAVLILGVAALFFLWASSFFVAWEGHAVSVRTPSDISPAAYTVLIVAEDGSDIEVTWPAEVVEGRELAFNDRGVPPVDLPEAAVATRKTRFQLVFYAEDAEGVNDVIPTTSPRSLGLSLLVFALLLGLRNMITSGSPVDYARRERHQIQEQTAMGQVAPPKQGKRISKKTRPEKRRSKRRR